MSWKVALYLRISQDRTGTELAVDRQRTECLKVVEQHGWSVAEEYVDNSVSAYSRKPRPAYQRMVEAVKAGVIDTVVVWDLDRLTRRPVEAEEWIDLHAATGVRLITVSEQVDLATDNGRLFLRIKVSVARAEQERKSTRQKASNAQRAASGLPMAGKRPFGWLADRVTLDPVEGPVLARMHADVLRGESLHGIARGLNAEGLTTSQGGRWSTVQVRKVLLRERNAGLLIRDGVVQSDSQIEAAVSEEDWRMVQDILAQRTLPGRKVEKALLSGLVRCGACGAPMGSKNSRSRGRATRTYLCQNQDKAGLRHATLVAHAADEFVAGALHSYWRAGLLDNSEPNADAELKRLTQAVAENAREREAATDALLMPGVDKGRIQRRLLELAAEREALEVRRSRVRVNTAGLEWLAALPNDVESEQDFWGWFEEQPLAVRRNMVASAFKLTVQPGGGKGVKRLLVELAVQDWTPAMPQRDLGPELVLVSAESADPQGRLHSD